MGEGIISQRKYYIGEIGNFKGGACKYKGSGRWKPIRISQLF